MIIAIISRTAVLGCWRCKGRAIFICRIFYKISNLKHSSHRTLLHSAVRDDILWWHTFLETYNGRSILLDEQPIECAFTDACNEAAGGSFGLDWFFSNWDQAQPFASSFHINEKEVLAVVLAAQRWPPLAEQACHPVL